MRVFAGYRTSITITRVAFVWSEQILPVQGARTRNLRPLLAGRVMFPPKRTDKNAHADEWFGEDSGRWQRNCLQFARALW